MRYIKYAFLSVVAICLITLALANRGFVTLNTLPAAMASDVPNAATFAYSVEVPLFVVILGGVAAGIVLGFIWEWLREGKHRSEVARKTAEVHALERELRRLKRKQGQGQDEVLNLLDEAS